MPQEKRGCKATLSPYLAAGVLMPDIVATDKTWHACAELVVGITTGYTRFSRYRISGTRPCIGNYFLGEDMKGNFGAIALVIIGVLILAHNLDLLELNVFQLLRVWWPLILILLGIGMFFTKDSHDKRDKQ